MEPVLPVSDIPIDFSIEEIGDISTLSAEQYLAWVRYQAQQMPPVSRKEINPQKTKFHEQSRTMPIIPDIEPCPAEFQPCPDWEAKTLEAFSDLRQRLETLSEDIRTRTRLITVPPLKDESGWRLFCQGTPLTNPITEEANKSLSEEGNLRSENKMQDIEEIDSDHGSETSGDEAEQSITPNATSPWTGATCVDPTTSLLLQFDQVLTQRVLTYHINWAEDNSGLSKPFTQRECQWLYALLARLEKPIDRDMESLIRQLHRQCCKRRARLTGQIVTEKDSDSYRPLSIQDEDVEARINVHDSTGYSTSGLDQIIGELNTLIAITGKYFGQGEHDRSILDMQKTIHESVNEYGLDDSDHHVSKYRTLGPSEDYEDMASEENDGEMEYEEMMLVESEELEEGEVMEEANDLSSVGLTGRKRHANGSVKTAF